MKAKVLNDAPNAPSPWESPAHLRRVCDPVSGIPLIKIGE